MKKEKKITLKEIKAVQTILEFIGENPKREGLRETPMRFLKAWRDAWGSGYSKNSGEIMKVFSDGGQGYDEMVVVKDIRVFSHCEHHICPIVGRAVVAYIPNGKILGLSKINRLVDMYARRLQVQERLTTQIAEAMDKELKPLGVAVFIEADHFCVKTRGIMDESSVTTTSCLKGLFKLDDKARKEFYSIVNKAQK